jgi:hypothetical protein
VNGRFFSERVSDAGPAPAIDPGIGAGVGKPPKNERAESDERLAVYGDLTEPRLWRGMVFAGSLRVEGR